MPEEVNEACIERYLDTHDIPDPDLLIRTSGEQRLSIIFCGSWHIQSSILQILRGRIFPSRNWRGN